MSFDDEDRRRLWAEHFMLLKFSDEKEKNKNINSEGIVVS